MGRPIHPETGARWVDEIFNQSESARAGAVDLNPVPELINLPEIKLPEIKAPRIPRQLALGIVGGIVVLASLRDGRPPPDFLLKLTTFFKKNSFQSCQAVF